MPHNSTFDRTAGSHSLAAAGQCERWAVRRQWTNEETEHCRATREVCHEWQAHTIPIVMSLAVLLCLITLALTLAHAQFLRIEMHQVVSTTLTDQHFLT